MYLGKIQPHEGGCALAFASHSTPHTRKLRTMAMSTRWLWTLDVHDDPTRDLEATVIALYDPSKVAYVLAGEEIGPANGRRHFQGLVLTRSRARGSTVKKLFSDQRVHIGDADGRPIRSLGDAITYCKKDGKWTELGEPPKIEESAAGPVTKRWERARDLAKEGKVSSIFEENPEFIRYADHLYRYAARFSHVEDRPTLDNIWIWGPSGRGKSSSVRKLEKRKVLVVKKLGERFMFDLWDSSRHEAILFDDVRITNIVGHEQTLKIVMDHYPFEAEMKGSSHGEIRPARIYVTSLLHPREVIPHDHQEEFFRRIKIYHIDEWLDKLYQTGSGSGSGST